MKRQYTLREISEAGESKQVKRKYTPREIGEALIEADGYLIDVVDLINTARAIMNYAGFTFDSYRRLTPEEE